MDFKGLAGKAQDLAGGAGDTANKMIKEFNEALPTLRALGFTMKDLRVGMGLIPEVGAKLVASADTVDAKKVKELIEKNAEKKTLVAALNGLLAAYNLKQEITDFPVKGIEIDLTMGLPPHIGVSFLSTAPAPAAHTAAAPAVGAATMQV